MRSIAINSSQKILILMCLLVISSRLCLDIYLPSLPAIEIYFNTDQRLTQLTLTTFLIGFAFSQIFYGPLSDSFGRRLVILSGMTIFIFGILLCLISVSIHMLLFSRFIAGIGAGVSSALKRAVASDLFLDHKLAKANTFLSNASLLTMLVAPAIGGYVEHIFGWRANFLIMLIYTSIIFILFFQILPCTHKLKEKPQFKLSDLPKKYLIVLQYKPFYINTIYSTCAFSGMVIFTTMSSFLFIKQFHMTPHIYGWIMMLIAISYLFSGLLVNFFAQKLGMKNLILYGLFTNLLSGIVLYVLSKTQTITVPMVLFSAMLFVMGSRIVIPNAMARSLSPLMSLSGYASSLIGVLQTIGGVVVSYIIAHFYGSQVNILAIGYIALSVLPLFLMFTLDYKEAELSDKRVAIE